MFKVIYTAKKFGYVGDDFFMDDKVKSTLPEIAKSLSLKIEEDVFFQVIE